MSQAVEWFHGNDFEIVNKLYAERTRRIAAEGWREYYDLHSLSVSEMELCGGNEELMMPGGWQLVYGRVARNEDRNRLGIPHIYLITPEEDVVCITAGQFMLDFGSEGDRYPGHRLDAIEVMAEDLLVRSTQYEGIAALIGKRRDILERLGWSYMQDHVW